MRKDFCLDCKQVIKISEGVLDNLVLKEKPFEFEDGWRCPTCAREHVKKVRGRK